VAIAREARRRTVAPDIELDQLIAHDGHLDRSRDAR
jgi:hypothetical protein